MICCEAFSKETTHRTLTVLIINVDGRKRDSNSTPKNK